MILDEWIERVIANPMAQRRQQDGRIRRWGVVPDGETVHNAFFDRSFQEIDK
jgi:hypothetical protein